MRYLECIEMLKYLLKKVYAGQRKQVPVSACKEVQEVVLQVNKKIQDDLLPAEVVIIRDILSAVGVAEETPGLLNLTDAMKSAIVDGLSELKAAISMKAFEYYKVNDFEPTEEIIPLMRGVVEVALEKGVI